MSGRGAWVPAPYARAGVDTEEAGRAITLLRHRLGGGTDLLGSLGGFAAALPLPSGYREPVIVTATDGVGTKTEIARLLGRRDTIGQDLVAMCVDDAVCHGARPLWFLDYLAVGRLDASAVHEIVGGIAQACDSAGCELVGGETAEHPGLMADDAFDLAGFCVGIVERADLLDGSLTRPGDVVVGIAASGLHANGYSLVRALIAHGSLDLASMGEALLAPTRIYAPHVLAIKTTLDGHGLRLGGIAHVTGGGLPGNLPRAVAPDLAVEVQVDTWPEPALIATIREAAGMSPTESRATLNAGIGMALIVEPAAGDIVVSAAEELGHAAWVIGRVVSAGLSGHSRYREVGQG